MKKAVCLLTALSMVLLTACGAADSSSASTTETAASSAGTAAAGEAGALPTITFMLPSFYGGELTKEGSDQVIAAYEDYTGISVDWTFVASDAYTDNFGLTLMDRANIPMCLVCTDQMNGTVVSAAQQGAFWDLYPFLESGDYPNLAQANQNVLDQLTVNDQLVGIPRTRDIGRFGLSYRKDWAEAVGITKDPETIEDVYNMLYAFTYDDPDGNGVNDTWGLEMCGSYVDYLDIIQTWFGVGKDWVEQDGELVPVHETAEYKEALDWLRKIYADGLVRSDWPTVQGSDWGQGCQRGEFGVFVDTMDGGRRIWDYFVNNDVMSVTNPEEPASMKLVGPIEGHTLAQDGYGGFILITKDGAKTEEDVKNCLTFLDKMCDPEMRVLADWGIEGLSYDLDENGDIVVKEGLEIANYPQQGLNQAVPAIPRYPEGMLTQAQTERVVAQNESYLYNEQFAVFNPAAPYLVNSEANALYGTDIELIISDARTQYICGTIDWDGFQEAVQQWNDRGGAQIKEEVNAQYQQAQA